MKTIPRVLSKRPKVGNQQNLGSPPIGVNHPDALAVDRFAAAMKAKLAQKRADRGVLASTATEGSDD